MCSRPAVSMMITSAPRSRPRATASNATAPGSDPSGPVTMSQPARCAHPSSCSTAAARNVSAAPSDDLHTQLLLEVPGELADRRRLAGPVDPHGHDHRRLVTDVDPVVAGPGDPGQQLDEPVLQRLAAFQPAGGRLLLELHHHLGGRGRADVGHDQRLLQALPRLVVQRVEQRRLDLAGQRLARLGHVLAQPAKEPTALLGLLRRPAPGPGPPSPVMNRSRQSRAMGCAKISTWRKHPPAISSTRRSGAPPASDLLAAMGREID